MVVKNIAYKLLRYEYWPWYVLYVPLLPIYLMGVLYTRKWLYITATNPAIDMGGFFGEKKDEILKLIPSQYLAKTIVVKNADLTNLNVRLFEAQIDYPLILKPIVGERGFGVKRVSSLQEILNYAAVHSDFLIQEYVSYELELGLMFYKLPSTNEVFVTSLAEKEYLNVIGDGINNVEQLLQANSRSSLYFDLVRREYAWQLPIVPKKHEKLIIHRVGNHCKGTRFINVNNKINPQIIERIKTLLAGIEGVFYGRFDLKIPSYKDLENGTNFKIFELNGVSSEPVHVYDLPNVFLAYFSLAWHWLVIIKVAKQNIKKGVKTTPFPYFYTQVKNHFF